MYRYNKDIKNNIFRGYDIRGMYPEELNDDDAYTFGLGFGSYIKNMGKTTCVIGHDNRLSGEALTTALKQGILETGIDIIDIGLVTTPMYYFACLKLGVYSGVMVTASHNPKDDNGFKFAYDESGNCKGEEIQDLYKFIIDGNFSKGEGKISTYDIREEYIELFKTNFNFGDRKVKVAIDPGNGTTSIIAKELFSLLPIDLIVINGESDPTFPNHHPDPCVEANLEQLKKVVIENNLDVGLGFDGDGDRIGVVSNTAKFIPTDKYMIIIVRDLINKVSNKEFLCDVKCSKSFIDECEKLGGKAYVYRTGNSFTKSKVRELNMAFGGELSGHVYFRDKWQGFDDGMYAGIRLLEILSNTNKSVDDLLEGINEYYSTEELRFETSDDIKFDVVKKVEEYVKEKGYDCLTIDGVKAMFTDGWALVRASNTGPNLTARFEASTKERLEEIQNEFISVINKCNKKD